MSIDPEFLKDVNELLQLIKDDKSVFIATVSMDKDHSLITNYMQDCGCESCATTGIIGLLCTALTRTEEADLDFMHLLEHAREMQKDRTIRKPDLIGPVEGHG